MQVQFREFDSFDLWIWVEFSTIPSAMEKQYIEELFNSWFYLGKLGGFNAENLQIQEEGLDLSYMHYNSEAADNSMMALMHNMAEIEYEGKWARCWLDMGTSDAIALDVLINALRELSKDYVPIEGVFIGGENEDWPIDSRRKPDFVHDN